MIKIIIISIVTTITFTLYSCTNCTNMNSKDAVHYKLSIVITDRLSSDRNSSYPEDIINLCKPYDTTCNKKFFMPTPITIYRLGKVVYEKELKVIAGKVTNFKSHVNSVDAFFIKGEGKTVGKELSTANSEDFNQIEFLNSYISSVGKKDKIFYYSQNSKNDSINGQKLFNDINELKSILSEFLCENQNFNIIVIYNPAEQKKTTIDTIESVGPSGITGKSGVTGKSGNQGNSGVTGKTGGRPKPPYMQTTLKFPSGTYSGEVNDKGLFQGIGTYTYAQRKLISNKDIKKRYAESGDYFIGEWNQGNVVQGKLYDKNNKLKEVIMIGK